MKTAPTTDRGRATVERILDVACELFHIRGVRATSLDQIAQTSKTGKGQIYHFFSGKSELVQSVIERQAQLVLEAQQPYLDDIATGEDLRGWVNHLVVLHDREDDPVRCPLGALAIEIGDSDVSVRSALNAAFGQWQARISAGLQRMVASGELDAETRTDALAGALIAAYEGGVLLSQVQGTTAPLRLILDNEVEQILARRR